MFDKLTRIYLTDYQRLTKISVVLCTYQHNENDIEITGLFRTGQKILQSQKVAENITIPPSLRCLLLVLKAAQPKQKKF